MPKTAADGWNRLLAGEQLNADRKLEEQRDKLVELWSADEWGWLTAVDPTTLTGAGLGPGYEQLKFPKGRPLIWTTDERDAQNPIKPFPAKEYLFNYVRDLASVAPEDRLLLVTKSRQMYFSTCTLLHMDYLCRFQLGRVCVLSKRTEDEAIKMLTEKTRRMHARLPLWVQQKLPMKATPAKVLRYPHTMSDTYAANETMAEGLARGGTATFVFVDEGAYQHHTSEIVAASLPMAAKLVLCSTPNISNPGGRAMKAIIDSKVKVA